MTLTLLLMLIGAAIVLAMRKWRRCSRALYALAVLLFLAVGCGPLPQLLLDRLQAPYAARVAPNWAPRNAIVLLTADELRTPDGSIEPSIGAYGRIAEAAALYHDCKRAGAQCQLLVSGGDPSHQGEPLAVVYGALLQRLTVPSTDLLLESRSMNTWQNAQFSRPLLQATDVQRVWLVTSGFHLRRSMLYFTHFDIAVTPVRADYLKAMFSAWPAWGNFSLNDVALHEYAGMARYHVYNAMGWNAPKPAAPVPAR